MGTPEKTDCPDGFCGADHRGYGGCLDESTRTKEAAIARLDGLTLEERLQEVAKVMERTITFIRGVTQSERGNECNLLDLGKYMTPEELKKEIIHMYDRNEMALALYRAAAAGANYSHELVHEVAIGKRKEYSNSEEARLMRQA